MAILKGTIVRVQINYAPPLALERLIRSIGVNSRPTYSIRRIQYVTEDRQVTLTKSWQSESQIASAIKQAFLNAGYSTYGVSVEIVGIGAGLGSW